MNPYLNDQNQLADAADETEPRALNWFDVSSSYGWYVKLPAFCVSHLQQIHDTLSFCRLFNSDAFKSTIDSSFSPSVFSSP
jgi:hypothetical protein